MTTNDTFLSSGRRQCGFTLLELVVVVLVASIVGVVALNYYYKLLVDVERTTMERDLGIIRSAVGMQVAGHYVAGKMATLEALAATNPMDLLAEQPDNYDGVVEYLRPDLILGRWYFDQSNGRLVYLVRNRFYFESELTLPDRAEFELVTDYSERSEGGGTHKTPTGLTLITHNSYRWKSPWGQK